MGTGGFILGLIFLTVVIPLWLVFHYVTKWRAQKSLSSADETALGDLWKTAQTLERRIANLEKALASDRADERS